MHEEGSGLSLVEPFGRSAAVGFKNHSLMINGSVRALTEIPRTLPARVPQVFLPVLVFTRGCFCFITQHCNVVVCFSYVKKLR